MMQKNKKEQIRQKFLKKRQNLSSSKIEEKSLQIIKRLEKIKEFKSAKKICIYFPVRNEINPLPLINSNPQKNFYLPKIKNDKLTFGLFTNETKLKNGKFHIPEPPTTTKNLIPDIIIIPGLAFDLHKNRIGYGKGYFDNFLKNLREKSKKTLILGIAMDFQILKKTIIPTLPHDQKMNLIITEKQIYQ